MEQGTVTITMEQGMVTITQEEYKELIRKSLRYDMLREIAQDVVYLTDKEKAIYGIKRGED